jgi:hypothetical protein
VKTLRGPSTFKIYGANITTVDDNGPYDLEPKYGLLKVKLPAAGTYNVCETSAPYVGAALYQQAVAGAAVGNSRSWEVSALGIRAIGGYHGVRVPYRLTPTRLLRQRLSHFSHPVQHEHWLRPFAT